jgi:hypothetical protein
MSDLENVPPSGRHPQDPAGTQPRYDPEALLPAEPIPDDVVDAEVVDEREAERSDLLPARRNSGGLGAVAPAKHSTYAPSFHFLTGALMAVGLAAIAGLVLFIVVPGNGGSSDSGVKNWSTWAPTTDGQAGAQQIAEHVGVQYKLPDGRQIVNVGVTGLEIQGVPLAVAVRKDASQGGAIKIFNDAGVIYHLCGLGQSCAIDTGKPSTERGLLLRREALELALYTFRYIENVNQVVVFLPPAPGKRGLTVLLRKDQVAPQLLRPLNSTLARRTPSVKGVETSPDATNVDRLTHVLYSPQLAQSNADAALFLVLKPFDPKDKSQTTTQSSGSGSSAESTDPSKALTLP